MIGYKEIGVQIVCANILYFLDGLRNITSACVKVLSIVMPMLMAVIVRACDKQVAERGKLEIMLLL